MSTNPNFPAQSTLAPFAGGRFGRIYERKELSWI